MAEPPSSRQPTSHISIEAERHILNEFHSELVNNMPSIDVSYLLLTEQLLFAGEYKKFTRMMEATNEKRNRFLLGCLLQRKQGFLAKFQNILTKTSLVHTTAEAIKRRMAHAASNKSAYAPEELWKEEKRKLENEVIDLKRRNKLLEKENNNFRTCIARFQSEFTKCHVPQEYTNQMHPESQVSSDTDPNDSNKDDSLSVSSISSDGTTIGPTEEEKSSATLVESSTTKNLSTQTSLTNLLPSHLELSTMPSLNKGSKAVTSRPLLNDPVKPFNVQVSNRNSPQYSSLTSLSGGSERSTTETHSNLGSTMSLSSSEKSFSETEDIKTPYIRIDAALTPAMHSIGRNTTEAIATSCVGIQTDLPRLKVPTSTSDNCNHQATQTDPIDTSKPDLTPPKNIIQPRESKPMETPSYTLISSGNNNGSQSHALTGADPKFAALMKKRRAHTDSGEVDGAIKDLETNFRTKQN